MKELIVIQHCQSEHHINGLTGGWTDTPLTTLGEEQAKCIGEYLVSILNGEEFELYSSDLMRASETATIISKYLGIDIVLDPRLREMNFGIATGKTRLWFEENVPKFSQVNGMDHRSCDGAETWREFYDRIAECLLDIHNGRCEKNIIVSHGGALNHIIAWWLKIPVNSLANMRFSGKPGGISKLIVDNHGFRVLDSLSDMRHIQSKL